MRQHHFEQLRPLCPVCRGRDGAASRLELVAVIAEAQDGQIVEGVLRCTTLDCLSEFPIIDGLPIIVPNVREYVSANIALISARDDLSDMLEGLIGDCCGPGSAYDVARQQASSYGWDHYGDLDPEETDGGQPGSIVRLLERALSLAGPIPAGPLIDVGCAVGRTSFQLAERGQSLVLGVDLNFGFLLTAARALRRSRVTYPRRRVGLVYDRRSFPIHFGGAANVDFWACDAAALPFAGETFAAAAALNVLDSVRSPIEILNEVSRVLRPGGKALIAAPYDWSPAVTPLEAWIGGHSQRGAARGATEPVLRALLTPGAHPSSVGGLRMVAEADGIPWFVRLHDRSTVAYQSHLVVGEKAEEDD